MAAYDVKYMLKRLVPAYIIILLIFFCCGDFGNTLQLVSIGITAIVSFRLFWISYMGENRLMVGMLPIGSTGKILRKLLWNVLFIAILFTVVLFTTCIFQSGFWGIYISFYNLNFVGYGILRTILISLNGFAAISLTKGRQGLLCILRNFIIISLITGALINLVAILPDIGNNSLYAAYIIIFCVMFYICKYNLDRQ